MAGPFSLSKASLARTFNGDLGMVCRENGQLWAFFPSPTARLKASVIVVVTSARDGVRHDLQSRGRSSTVFASCFQAMLGSAGRELCTRPCRVRAGGWTSMGPRPLCCDRSSSDASLGPAFSLGIGTQRTRKLRRGAFARRDLFGALAGFPLKLGDRKTHGTGVVRIALLYHRLEDSGARTSSGSVDGPPHDYVPGDLDGDFHQIPYGMLTIGAQAIRAGHQVKVFNLSAYSWDDVVRVVEALDADLFGMSCWTANRRGVALVADLIRQSHPQAHIVVGGPHASPLAPKCSSIMKPPP